MGCERGEKIKIIKVELFHFHSQLRLRKYVTLRGAAVYRLAVLYRSPTRREKLVSGCFYCNYIRKQRQT